MKKAFIIIILFASFTMKSFGFQSGDLLYTIISSEPPCVRLDGHINGHSAQGQLIIPETVTHEDIVYTVTTIKENAFYSSHITSVVFPAGLTTIEAYAFECCQLTSLHIPATLTSIGGYAFVDNKFESITVEEANPIYDSRDNCNALIETATNTLITGCFNTIIPHSVVVLGSGAFIHCERLKSINIPECITRIENNVFEDCDSLETVVLPASLTFIGNHAFCYCGIRSITTKATIPPAATYDPNDPYNYDTFLGVSRTIPVYIPFGTTQAYRQAPGWNRFSDFIEEDPILYTDFEPDSVLHVGNHLYPNEMRIDIDNDNLYDIRVYWFLESPGVTVMLESRDSSVKMCQAEEGDTISHLTDWWTGIYYPHLYENYAVRIEKDGNYYYGWFRTYIVFIPSVKDDFCFDKFAFCTIPNYPLVWGQTEIENYILYIDFEPDSCITSSDDQLWIDFDNDDIADIYLSMPYTSGGFWPRINAQNDWEITWLDDDGTDIIPNIGHWGQGYEWLDNEDQYRFAARKQTGNGTYLYVWFEAYVYVTTNPFVCHLCFNKFAYCLIPDYPLIWGQTYLNPIGQNGAEWYYEIEWDNGSITYQHLECVGDTLIERGGKRPKIIVRSNTHYNRDTITEVTHEYVYEENGIVYWWNKTLEEFTVLYDLASPGDEWEVKVGNESLTMHVDTVETIEYEGRTYRMLRVSDPEDLFSGSIVCGIGHLTSFFPEKLMNRGRNYRVEGMRCYWVEGELMFKIGDQDCDAIYEELQNIEEPYDNNFTVYPNPANGILFVETRHGTSLPDQNEYRITNLMGQTLLQGIITTETQQINIAELPAGMYFISLGEQTIKFVKQ